MLDYFIAATAENNGMEIATRNTQDFKAERPSSRISCNSLRFKNVQYILNTSRAGVSV